MYRYLLRIKRVTLIVDLQCESICFLMIEVFIAPAIEVTILRKLFNYFQTHLGS
jgi:hypothetical protein